jgi:hypothetical protein
VGIITGSAFAENGKDTSEEGEDVEEDCWMNCGENEMALLAALPPVAPDIILRTGIPGIAASSVYQGILRIARDHLAMSSNKEGSETMLLAFALKELEIREDEEDADMHMLALVRKMIEAGDVRLPFDTQQAGDLNIQENAGGELEAAPETSQGTTSSPQRLRLMHKASQWRTHSETQKLAQEAPVTHHLRTAPIPALKVKTSKRGDRRSVAIEPGVNLVASHLFGKHPRSCTTANEVRRSIGNIR